jgi:hypothetical protein
MQATCCQSVDFLDQHTELFTNMHNFSDQHVYIERCIATAQAMGRSIRWTLLQVTEWM